MRKFVKDHQERLSPTTVSLLQEKATECARRENDPVRREEEEQKLERQTSAAEKEEIPGIYVYALPHYLRYPIEISDNDETDNRTYLKVGMSERDAIKRFRQQRGSTALPEPPILLRIYVGSNGTDIAEVERKIHRHLNAADHVRNSERGAGQEWFLTHLKLLDSTAELLGLKTHFTIDDYGRRLELTKSNGSIAVVIEEDVDNPRVEKDVDARHRKLWGMMQLVIPTPQVNKNRRRVLLGWRSSVHTSARHCWSGYTATHLHSRDRAPYV